jgi:hypothetical protein
VAGWAAVPQCLHGDSVVLSSRYAPSLLLLLLLYFFV